jgi:hypothetical protein
MTSRLPPVWEVYGSNPDRGLSVPTREFFKVAIVHHSSSSIPPYLSYLPYLVQSKIGGRESTSDTSMQQDAEI